MSVTQTTFDVFRGIAYPGMPATGRYQNIDGCQLVPTSKHTPVQVFFGDPVSMGTKANTVVKFDSTRPFGGVVVRNFYVGDGVVGEKIAPSFNTNQKHWDIDCGVFGDWWVKVSNDCENGQPVTITTDGKFAGGLVTGNFILEGATFRSPKTASGLAWIELTGSRKLTKIVGRKG